VGECTRPTSPRRGRRRRKSGNL